MKSDSQTAAAAWKAIRLMLYDRDNGFVSIDYSCGKWVCNVFNSAADREDSAVEAFGDSPQAAVLAANQIDTDKRGIASR